MKIASSGAVVSRASTWHRMYVYGELGFMLGMEAPLSTLEVVEQLCVSTLSIDALNRSNCVYRDRTLELRNKNSWNQRTKVWIQTKVLFQIDSEVEQVDPNRNQMEQSKGLEVIKSRDMEVGLSRGQPWKGNPIKPVKAVKSWFH